MSSGPEENLYKKYPIRFLPHLSKKLKMALDENDSEKVEKLAKQIELLSPLVKQETEKLDIQVRQVTFENSRLDKENKDLKKENAELEREIEAMRMVNASLRASFFGRLGRQLKELQLKMAENDSKSV